MQASACSRSRSLARPRAGSRKASVRLANPSWKRVIISDERGPRFSRYASGIRALGERLVAVADDVAQEGAVVGVGSGNGKLGAGGACRAGTAELAAEQLHSVAEAHVLDPHDEVDHRAARLAGAEAVPEILGRRHHERRLVVVVEGAEANEVTAVRLEHHPAHLGKPLDGDVALQPLELCIWDAAHRDPPTNSLHMRRTAN